MNARSISIFSEKDEVAPFLGNVQQAADAHTHALGFFPASVFTDYAKRDQLYVAVQINDGQYVYAGHLLFDLRFPRAHILQMYCSPDARRSGVGTKLLDHLKSVLTHSGFIAVYARVANDLQDAISFWTRQGFYLQRTVRGSAARKRRITVRVLELASPQLFPLSGLGEADKDPLGLHTQTTSEPPLYLIDLNVLFDLQPRRVRHQVAVNLFRANNEGLCRLAISSEIRRELQRHQPAQGRTDPMVELIDTLPEFVLDEQSDDQSPLFKQLAAQIFPTQWRNGKLSQNDESDLRHLITAINLKLTGFITNDEAILSAADELASAHGIQVLSPNEFQLHEPSNADTVTVNTPSKVSLGVQPLAANDADKVRGLLTKSGLTAAAIANGWLSPDGRKRAAYQTIVWCDQECIGYVTWPKVTAATNYTVHAVVDESHCEAPNAARALLRHVIQHMSDDGPCHLTLTVPRHQSQLREVAYSLGFRATSEQFPLSKILVGKVFTESLWPKYRDDLAKLRDLKLPDRPPQFTGSSQSIEIYTPDGNRRYISLELLETLLSPVLFCLPGRNAVISPIERRFAEPLLGHSPQRSLLPAHSASLYAARHYLCHPRSLKHLQRGTLMFFYESGKGSGEQAVVAVARIVESYLRRRDALLISDFDQSVLRPETLDEIGQSDIRAVSVIDNIFPLKKPVPLSRLQAIGCGTPNQLITTKPINANQLQSILKEGFSDD